MHNINNNNIINNNTKAGVISKQVHMYIVHLNLDKTLKSWVKTSAL
jgi:hypothetical protein